MFSVTETDGEGSGQHPSPPHRAHRGSLCEQGWGRTAGLGSRPQTPPAGRVYKQSPAPLGRTPAPASGVCEARSACGRQRGGRAVSPARRARGFIARVSLLTPRSGRCSPLTLIAMNWQPWTRPHGSLRPAQPRGGTGRSGAVTAFPRAPPAAPFPTWRPRQSSAGSQTRQPTAPARSRMPARRWGGCGWRGRSGAAGTGRVCGSAGAPPCSLPGGRAVDGRQHGGGLGGELPGRLVRGERPGDGRPGSFHGRGAGQVCWARRPEPRPVPSRPSRPAGRGLRARVAKKKPPNP